MDFVIHLILKLLPDRFKTKTKPYSKLAKLHIAQIGILLCIGIATIITLSPNEKAIYCISGIIDSVTIQKDGIQIYEKWENVFKVKIWVMNRSKLIQYDSYDQNDSLEKYIKPGMKVNALCMPFKAKNYTCDAIELQFPGKSIGSKKEYFRSKTIARNFGWAIICVSFILLLIVIKRRDDSKYKQAINRGFGGDS